jgi:hypothetical protein
MRKVAPTRQLTLLHDLKSRQAERPAPVMLHLKCAWTSAATPLSIVCPADHTVPPDRRYIFVNDCQAATS